MLESENIDENNQLISYVSYILSPDRIFWLTSSGTAIWKMPLVLKENCSPRTSMLSMHQSFWRPLSTCLVRRKGVPTSLTEWFTQLLASWTLRKSCCVDCSLCSLRNPNMYRILKPHLDTMFREIIFPVICFNAQDQELWNEDPQEYLRKEFGRSFCGITA